ncbi:MAG: hypothetical protein JSV35_08080 [Candidatus Bathyarchaeota archaeon]|nr:MAG: hypothetical protein JSV35_08080 [Candidatus Bathyarchaeota archaeon]
MIKSYVWIVGVIGLIVVAVGYSLWTRTADSEYLSKTKHDSDRWAVIRDSNGDIIAVESTDDETWNTLQDLRQNQTEMWIGGIIESYDNKWNFRFRPDTIIVARFTVEGGQSNIQGISTDLDYWINIWTKETYVLATVIEIHDTH